ncbi:MAG: hypothetical protein ABIJ73_10010, partial [Pseudomonadota bacterium]
MNKQMVEIVISTMKTHASRANIFSIHSLKNVSICYPFFVRMSHRASLSAFPPMPKWVNELYLPTLRTP